MSEPVMCEPNPELQRAFMEFLAEEGIVLGADPAGEGEQEEEEEGEEEEGADAEYRVGLILVISDAGLRAHSPPGVMPAQAAALLVQALTDAGNIGTGVVAAGATGAHGGPRHRLFHGTLRSFSEAQAALSRIAWACHLDNVPDVGVLWLVTGAAGNIQFNQVEVPLNL